MTIRAAVTETNRSAVAAALVEAIEVFRVVDRACTRFSSDSPLMQANARGDAWTAVGATCFAALVEAHTHYVETAGRFDPRVLDDLVRLGYDRSLAHGGISRRGVEALKPRPPRSAWRPQFRADSHQVRLGMDAIDLGGIGKGLAVRWAARRLERTVVDYLIDAGGDCWCSGRAPDRGPWRLAVEDPHGGAGPVAVLALSGLGVATSSVRICQWRIGQRVAHHLVDPSSGLPGGAGLAAVTVVAADAAEAEVWSKVLFLEGGDAVANAARARGLAALWVDDRGEVAVTPQLLPHVVWQAA